MRRILPLLGVIVLALCPARALALNNTINSALPIAFGEVRTQDMAVGQIAYFNFEARAGRSYFAVCMPYLIEGAATPGGEFNACGVFDVRDGTDTVVRNGTVFGGDVHFLGGQSLNYVAGTTARHFIRLNSVFVATTFKVLVLETTLFSPWYFISSATGYEGFVELKNNTALTVTATVTAFAADGSQVGTVTRTIPGNGNTFVAIGSEFSIAAGTGSVQIAHVAGPGGISANVTTLGALTGLSFDAPATPRMVWATFQ